MTAAEAPSSSVYVLGRSHPCLVLP